MTDPNREAMTSAHAHVFDTLERIGVSADDKALMAGAIHSYLEMFERQISDIENGMESRLVEARAQAADAVFHTYASSALQAIIARGEFKTPGEGVDLAFNYALGAVTRHRDIIEAGKKQAT